MNAIRFLQVSESISCVLGAFPSDQKKLFILSLFYLFDENGTDRHKHETREYLLHSEKGVSEYILSEFQSNGLTTVDHYQKEIRDIHDHVSKLRKADWLNSI